MCLLKLCDSCICMVRDIKNIDSKRGTGGLKSLSVSVVPLIRNIMGKKGFVISDILTVWEQIVGEEMAQYTIPRKVDFKKNEKTNGVIHIVVPGGAFALELQHKEKFVLEKVNSYFGYKAISGIRIIQDANFKIQTKKINQAKVKKSLVTCEEQNYIDNLTNEIIDPELKETLFRLGESIFNENHE